MSAHTPGPWESDGKVVQWLSGEAPAVRVHSDGRPVCMVQPHLSGKYAIAGSFNPVEDARLIAAAPDLLQAWLDYIEQWNVRHDDPKCPMDDTCECPLVGRINAAIAKAVGR